MRRRLRVTAHQVRAGHLHLSARPEIPFLKAFGGGAEGIAFDQKENLIYLAQGGFVRVLDYPSGSLVAVIPVDRDSKQPTGVALIPAPQP